MLSNRSVYKLFSCRLSESADRDRLRFELDALHSGKDPRMMAIPERTKAFQAYRRRTSVWVPWWPRADRALTEQRQGGDAA